MLSVHALRQPLLTRTASLFALAAFAPAVLAQITVGPPGSGANFQQISAAVAAAAPGAKIFVLPGIYDPFVVTQSVSILGEDASQCVVSIPLGSNVGLIEVSQLPASHQVRISGLSLDPTTSSPEPRIAVRQCAGRVAFVDVFSEQLAYSSSQNIDESVALVEDSDTVHFENCLLKGSGPPGNQSWQNGSSGLEVINSRVWCSGCTTKGGPGYEGYGGSAIRASAGSFVHLSRTTAIGGSGGAHIGFYWWDIYAFSGEEAVSVSASELVVAGGTGNQLEGGAGGNAGTDWGGGGPAIWAMGQSVVRYASDAVLIGGFDGIAQYQTPQIFSVVASDLVVAEAHVRPTLMVVPADVAPGQTAVIESDGDAGALHAVFVSFDTIAPVLIPNGQFVHIDPNNAVLLSLTPIGAIGVGSVAVPVPAIAALSGLELTLQALDTNLASLRITNPALLTVGL